MIDPSIKVVNIILECNNNKEETLDLSYRILQDLPVGLNLLTNVKKLILKGNFIETINSQNLPPNLEVLNLTNNRIGTFTKLNVPDYTKITELYLGNNMMKEFDFDSFPNLKILDLSDNNIGEVNDINDNLEELYIQNNTVLELPLIPAKIKRLDISSNIISEFFLCAENYVLEYIDFSNNYMDTIPPLTDTMIELYCSGNIITKIEDADIPLSMEVFVAAKNKISQFEPELHSIKNLETHNHINLRVLDLAENRLSIMPDLPHYVEIVDFSNNFLDDDYIAIIPDSVKVLNLSENRLTLTPLYLQDRADAGTLKLNMKENLHTNSTKQTYYPAYGANGWNQGYAQYYNRSSTNYTITNYNLKKNRKKLLAQIFNSQNAKKDNPYYVSIRNTKHIVV